MKSYVTTSDEIELGGDTPIEMVLVFNEQGETISVRFRVGEDGGQFELDPEVLERVAVSVERSRRRRGDKRFVCVDHGYYGAGCTKCIEETQAKETVERLKGETS